MIKHTSLALLAALVLTVALPAASAKADGLISDVLSLAGRLDPTGTVHTVRRVVTNVQPTYRPNPYYPNRYYRGRPARVTGTAVGWAAGQVRGFTRNPVRHVRRTISRGPLPLVRGILGW